MLALTTGSTAQSQTIRIATFNTELQRKGPGLLLRDIARGDDPQVTAVIKVIAATQPDVLVLQGIDYDLTGLTLTALAKALAASDQSYPYQFAARPNAGVATGLDMDGDGRLGGARDAQGYGRFAGQGGMAILSRYPIDTEGVQDFSTVLWRDLPDALLPQHPDGRPFPSAAALDVQRLSSQAHWVVPINAPHIGTVNLLTFHATPPVFDGDEDRNGRRNHDEILFWDHFLQGRFGPAPKRRFVLLGDANLDPAGGEGRHEAINTILNHPLLQDPVPKSAEGTATVDWRDPVPGDLRVDYVLPSADWRVVDTGVYWSDEKHVATASRHRLVWVDLMPPS